MGTIIHRIPDKDLNDVVRVHNSAFKGFFLTELGSHFLRQYYKCVSSSSEGLLLGAYNDGILIGFCAACCKSVGYNTSLIKHNFIKFGLIGIKLLLTKPKALYHLICNLSKTDKQKDKGDYAELMTIAVEKNSQNTGAGKLLLAHLEYLLHEKGVTRLSLTTDADNNLNTLGFYKTRGFNEMYAFTTYPNRKMYRLIKPLNQPRYEH